MLEKKSFRQLVALTLVIVMVFSLLPSNTSYAAENYDDSSVESSENVSSSEDSNVIEEESETTEEETVIIEPNGTEINEESTEETSEAIVEEKATEASTEVITETTEVTTEELTTEAATETTTEVEEVDAEIIPTFTQIYDGVDVSGKDFSSCELLIATEDPSIFTYDTEVVSEYNGIYLTRYPDATQTMNAYTYYFSKAPLVEVNTNNFKGADEEGNEQAEEESSDDGDVPQPEEVIEPSSEEVAEEVAEEIPAEPEEEIPNDGHGEADLSNLNNGDDAFSAVNDLGAGGYSGYIALIDTGANGADASVSVLGGGTGDDNGHGSRMASKIREMNPNAKILSIKALDSSNRGQASDIYAAINYAIDSNVSIINLSLTSLNTADCELVVSAIQQAINRGIVVVGAAGNYGSNASYFVPGCVDGAVICTATDENGIRLGNANFGSTVDYYVVADSTSEAAATVSGLISRDGLGFNSGIVRTEEGVIATETDATETDAVEEDDNNVEFELIDDINKKAALNKELEDRIWWLGGIFRGQAPAGYPTSFTADVWFNQTDDSADENHVIGYLYNWNVRSGINLNEYDYVAGGQAVYCNCSLTGYTDDTTTNTSTNGQTVHHHGPAGVYDHRCRTPGAQLGNWNNLQVTNTTFVYDSQTTYNGKEYAVYRMEDCVDQYKSTAGVQMIRIYVYIRKESQPGYVSLHKQALNPDGTPFSGNAPSMDGIIYTLYDKAYPSTSDHYKIADFVLGADGYCKQVTNINPVRAEAGKDEEVEINGHKYLKWTSTSSQNWFFKETSVNSNYLINADQFDVLYEPTATKTVSVGDKVAKSYIRVTKKSTDATYKANLNGAEFKVFDTQTKAQTALTSKNYSQAIGTLTVPSSASSTGLTNTLDVSNYMGGATTKYFYIVESKAPANYLPNPSVQQIQAKVGTTATNPVNLDISEQPTTYMILQKTSANTSCTNGNPNYELSNAVYRIFKNRQDAVDAMASGDWSKALKNGSGDIINLRTNASGVSNKVDMSDFMNTNTNGTIRNTQFFLAEYRAPKNYKMNNVPKAVTVTVDNDVNDPAIAEVSDTPVDDPVDITVVKQYKDGHTEPLPGAKFTVKFYAQLIEENYTFEQLSAMDEDWSKDFTTDNTGETFIRYGNNENFPIGYITIEEVEAPEGFKLDGSVTTINNTQISNKIAAVTVPSGNASDGYNYGEVVIVNDDGTRGEILRNAQVTNPIIVGDEEISIDFEIKKECGDDGTPIEAATFEIKNNDTGEVHTFKTDDKGYYSSHSSYVSHSAPNGIWFINGPQGIVRDVPDDTKGALTEGSYTVTEIDAAGHQKEEPITFNATEDGKVYTIYDDGRGDGLKIMSDMELPSIGTLALVELFADGSSLTDDEYEDIMKNFDGDESSLPDGVYKVLPATSGQKITDVCHYKNLRYNTDFTLYGRLMQIDKDGNVTPFVSNGKEVTGITHFHTPDTYEKSQYDSCGYETVRFEDLDFTGIQDTSFVVYESLYVGTLTEDDIASGNYDTTYVGLNNDTVEFPVEHAVATDKNQTVTTPTGQTQALSEDGTKTVSVLNKHFVIYDTCSYKGLIKGRTYEITGYVYEKPLNPKKKYTEDELKALRVKDKNGEYITGSTTFTAEKSEGSVVVKFEFDMDYKVQKKSYVVGEKCYDKDSGNVLVFTHEDISDHDQSFYEPVISTQTKKAESCIELCLNEGKFIDTVFIENTEPNAEFTIKGKVMDKDTGKELLLNGKPVTASTSITTGDSTNSNGSTDGYYDIEFVLSEDQIDELNGKNIVVYEYLYNKGGTLISKHEDLDDIEQSLKFVKIGTIAKDAEDTDNEKLLKPDGKYKLVDSVSFSNIELNHEYTLNGTIMRKDTGLPLLDKNGNEIKASTKFTPKTESGSVDVIFEFETDVVDLDIVVFEEMTIETGVKSIPVGYHRDINSKDQTVRIGSKGRLDLDKNNKGRGRSGRTGDNIPLIPVVAVMITALVGGIIIISRKKRTN